MDLRVYFQKVRQIEADIEEPYVAIISRDTSDGGKAGVTTDVPRRVAAKLIAEEKADLAVPKSLAKVPKK